MKKRHTIATPPTSAPPSHQRRATRVRSRRATKRVQLLEATLLRHEIEQVQEEITAGHYYEASKLSLLYTQLQRTTHTKTPPDAMAAAELAAQVAKEGVVAAFNAANEAIITHTDKAEAKIVAYAALVSATNLVMCHACHLATWQLARDVGQFAVQRFDGAFFAEVACTSASVTAASASTDATRSILAAENALAEAIKRLEVERCAKAQAVYIAKAATKHIQLTHRHTVAAIAVVAATQASTAAARLERAAFRQLARAARFAARNVSAAAAAGAAVRVAEVETFVLATSICAAARLAQLAAAAAATKVRAAASHVAVSAASMAERSSYSEFVFSTATIAAATARWAAVAAARSALQGSKSPSKARKVRMCAYPKPAIKCAAKIAAAAALASEEAAENAARLVASLTLEWKYAGCAALAKQLRLTTIIPPVSPQQQYRLQ